MHDPRDATKQRTAIAVVERLRDAGRLSTSVQCLVEFYGVVTRKLPDRMPADEALAEVSRYVRFAQVMDLTGAIVLDACRGASAHRLSLWDALVWATARLNQIRTVLTEDVPHGRSIEGVTYLSPFDAQFDIAALIS